MMNIKYSIHIAILLIFTFSLIQCTHEHAPGEDHAHDHGTDPHATDTLEEESENMNEVELTNEQLANIGVEMDSITPRKIRSLVKLNGRVELPPLGKSVVGTSLDGKITGIFTQPGQYVRKGQKLFTLENLMIIDWQQDLAKEQAELVYLRKELARQKTLAEDQIAPLKNVEATQAKIQQSEATTQALQSKLKSIGISFEGNTTFQSHFSVYAPASGVVQHLAVDMGAFIQAGEPMAALIDNDNLHLHLSAFGGDIAKLEKDQIINFFVHSRPNEILKAEIFWINSIVDNASNSYDVHAKILEGNHDLISGEFVEARVINQEQIIQTLPIESVSMDKGLHYIFIKEEDHGDAVHFLKLQVSIGESDLGYVEVLPIDPIPLKAEVVTKGAFFLMAQSKKGEEGAGGHSH